MKPDGTLIDIVHQLIARHAARAFEAARLLGVAVPAAWDFGLKYARDYTQIPAYASPPKNGAWYRFTLRANDVTRDVVTFVRAEALLPVWIAKHPEALGDDPQKMQAKLDSLETSDAAIDDWASKAAEIAKQLIYRRIR